MNVLYLTVDALTYSRLGAGGASPSPSPAMDALIDSGLSFSRLFSAGCPTMFAAPAIFTSSLPLDEGGYGMGIRHRGTSIAEVYRAAGYRTAGFCTGFYLGRIFGYDRGFEHYHQLFPLGGFHKVLRGLYLDYLTAVRNQGLLTFEQCIPPLVEWLHVFLPGLQEYCVEKLAEPASPFVAASPLLHDETLSAVAHFAAVQRESFRRSPLEYAARLLELGHEPGPFEFLPELVGNERLRQRVTEVEHVRATAGRSRSQQSSGPSARYMVGNLMRWIDRQSTDTPWFAWSHLMDCHDLNFVSYDCDLPAGVLEAEARSASALAAELAAARGPDTGSVEYDLAIAYVDSQIQRLLFFLEEKGLRETTMIVLHSDHGGWRNGYPPRPEGSGYMSFYDEMYHVPLVFCHPAIPPRRVHGLMSALDVAPTMLCLSGHTPPASFQGQDASVPGWTGRDFVQMEHLGSGPCDLLTKRLQLCIRSDRYKAVCETPPLLSGADGALLQFFDLAADPLEQENLVERGDLPEEASRLLDVVERRYSELRSFNFGAGIA